jgi:hypothetical protein
MSQYPLANDEEGNVVEVPALAVGWLVRRHSGGRGRPGVVYDRGGRPLVVPLEATADDLRAAGCAPGSYRLDAISDDRRLLNVTAYTELTRGVGDDETAGPASVPRDAEVSALARICEAMQRTQTEQVRAAVERERQLLETIQKLAHSPSTPSQIERLRNARSEDVEVRAFLRDALEQERRAARRAAKAERRARRQAATTESTTPPPPWVSLITTAAPIVTVAAAALGEKFGMTYEQSTELLKVTGQFKPFIEAAAAAVAPGAPKSDDDQADDDGDDRDDDRRDEDDDRDDADDDGDSDDDDDDDDTDDDDDDDADDDDDDGADDDDDDDGNDSADNDSDRTEGSIRTTLRAIAKAAELKDPVLLRKVRRVLALLTRGERQLIGSNLARVPKPIVAVQIQRLREMSPAQAADAFRSMLGGSAPAVSS